MSLLMICSILWKGVLLHKADKRFIYVSMNYECIVPVLKRLYVDTSKCTYCKYILILTYSDTIPLEKDRAILASGMKRILRIPKRIYDGIKK